jgi:4-amino-4-deoxy-L-arabinose transferase-like glycosyltransferase
MRWRLLAGLAIGLVLAAALAFRLIDLDHVPGINADEARYGAQVLSVLAGQPMNLRTTAGKPPNLVYMGPLWLLHALAPAPALWKLRAVAFLSGVLTLVAAYGLVARLRDRQTGLLTALVLACLPTAIVYSRLGWDPCQIILAGLVCMYFALQRRLLGTVAALVIALLIHPTCIFLVPVLLGPVVAEQIAQRRQAGAARPAVGRMLGYGLGLAAVIGVTLALILWVIPPDIWLHGGLTAMGQRLIQPAEWSAFALNLADLFTGTSVYRHVAGPPVDGVIVAGRVGLVVLLGGLLLIGMPRLVRRGDWQILGLLGGLAVSLLGFLVVAGPGKIAAGWEWYGLFAVAPAAVAAACLLRSLGDSRMAWRLQLAGVLAVGALLLGGFYAQFFRTIWATGGEAGRQFRTGPVEPKQQAYAIIIAAVGDESVTVLAEDWWSAQPIHYLICLWPETRVLLCEQAADVPDLRGQQLFVVGFVGSPCHEWLIGKLPRADMKIARDYAGRPVLYVVELTGQDALLPALAEVAAKLPGDTRRWPVPPEGPR